MGIKIIRGEGVFEITNPIKFMLKVDRPTIAELPYLYKDLGNITYYNYINVLEIKNNLNVLARL